MTETAHPIILYVPGLLPKPEPEVHNDALQRCLLAGLRRIDNDVAAAVATTAGGFDIVSWTYDFYREHRDFEIDRGAVDNVISQPAAGARDIAEATGWRRRMTRWIYHLGDLLPFLIPHLASERTELHLRDLQRYVHDDNGIADHTRRMLKIPVRAAAEGKHPLLLIGHSMGSVIAYDALWEMSHHDGDHAHVDLLLTMGSPLGQRYMQKRIRGHELQGADRYPGNIRAWQNLSAVGELTSIDPTLRDDFGELLELGLVESLVDEEVFTWFRLNRMLNVHSEYGYLVTAATARIVADWWRVHDASLNAG